MYKTKGVGDDKSELWLKDRGELAKYRDVDCRWPKTLRTAWKKRGYDSHRDAAVMMVPYCPFAPLLVSWRRQHHWRRQQQQRRLPHACLLSTTALRAAARIAQAAGWVSGALLVLLSRSPAVHRHLHACTPARCVVCSGLRALCVSFVCLVRVSCDASYGAARVSVCSF